MEFVEIPVQRGFLAALSAAGPSQYCPNAAQTRLTAEGSEASQGCHESVVRHLPTSANASDLALGSQ